MKLDKYKLQYIVTKNFIKKLKIIKIIIYLKKKKKRK